MVTNKEVRNYYDKVAMRLYGRKYSSNDLLPYEQEQVRKQALKSVMRKKKKETWLERETKIGSLW